MGSTRRAAGLIFCVAEPLAQCGNAARDDIVGLRAPVPDFRDELVLGDNLAAVTRQNDENIHYQRFQPVLGITVD